MVNHKCLHEGDLRVMQRDVEKVKIDTAKILSRMDTRDTQREIDRIMYKEGIDIMKLEIATNSIFRQKTSGIIGFIAFMFTVLGATVIYVVQKVFK